MLLYKCIFPQSGMLNNLILRIFNYVTFCLPYLCSNCFQLHMCMCLFLSRLVSDSHMSNMSWALKELFQINVYCPYELFSSPEHAVLSELLWSFNVRRPSSVRASVRPSTISLNNISSESAYWILTKLHRNDPWVVPYQSCSNRSS